MELREAIQMVKQRACAGGVPVPAMEEAMFLVACAAESTIPKTVEVWRVEFAWLNGEACIEQRRRRADAETLAGKRREGGATCIRITGPHQQEVPA